MSWTQDDIEEIKREIEDARSEVARRIEESPKEEMPQSADVEAVLRASETTLRTVNALVSVTLGECQVDVPYAPMRPVIDVDGNFKWCCTHPEPHCSGG